MTNSDLINKLHRLQKIKTDSAWLEDNRKFLLTQISNSGAESLSFTKKLLITFNSFSKAVAQPVYVLGLLVIMLITGSLLGQRMLAKTQPNNSLYLARVIADNIKVNTTFNTQDRNRLAAQYASLHAQDISQVLANPKFNTSANHAQVAKLNASFNQEVKTAKSRIDNLKNINSQIISQVNPTSANTNSGKVSSPTIIKSTTPTPETLSLTMADSFKTKNGISIVFNKSLASTSSSSTISNTEKISTSSLKITKSSTTKILATSTNSNSSSSSKTTVSQAIQTLDEAQKLFNSKDYQQAANKLQEVKKIIQ